MAANDPSNESSRTAFDPSYRFLPLRAFADVPGGRVVVLAPHPDDEVIGCGGAVTRHVDRGDDVVVVHVTDGAGGATDDATRDAIRKARRGEAERAGNVLGLKQFRGLDFPDGGLRPGGAFESGLLGLLETLRPDVIYVPSPFEHHPDHRATYLLAAGALQKSELDPVCLLYEVNEPQAASYLLDITDLLARKEKALRCFESQQQAMDITRKTLDANRARTVNVDLPEVLAAEPYLQTTKRWLMPLANEVEQLRRLVDEAIATNDASSQSGGEGSHPRGPTVPVTAVISTWNKRDDVRENLLGLKRQTRPPAEIVVVDNASSDGTADMIEKEFPEVKLIRMPHDKKGACETFNIGMKAATERYTAIMDDDVVAPPEWLELLVERIEREPASTAMVSSKVIEPGMPEEFLRSAAVDTERYMATFRGCGTLARSEVLKAAGYYDEVFFIYGNERDLSSRVLNLGHRILQYPKAEIFHKTPFGMKAGKRSLYYHVRNFWLYSFKYCSVGQILRSASVLGRKGLGIKGKKEGYTSDATGTIGIDKSIKETEGGLWIAFKATFAAIALLPYCLRHRSVCRAPDFEPPVK